MAGGKNGFFGAPEPSTKKSRPSSLETLTRGSVTTVDVLPPAGGEIFAGGTGWTVGAVREVAGARDLLEATF